MSVRIAGIEFEHHVNDERAEVLYLHARSASEPADRFTRALGGADTPTLAEPVAPGVGAS